MRINRSFLTLCRTVHIYLTMFGLLVMLLFAVTGFTVNHENWFGATRPRVSELAGQTPKPLLDQNDSLRIVEHLRQTFHITGAMSGYDDLGEHLSIGFKSPGRSWEVEVDKASGATRVTCEAFNAIAVINNLHRGRYAGPAWSWVIDAGAILILLACLTGIVLWLALPKRRKLGITMMALGAAATLLIFWMLVPGPDARLLQPAADSSGGVEQK